MKYVIWETLLTEYTEGPTLMVLLEEIDAVSHEEAHKLARLRYPTKGILRIDDGETAVEYKGPLD